MPKDRASTAIAKILNRMFQETNKTILYPFHLLLPLPPTTAGHSLFFPKDARE